jgi:hypothetical protein
VAVCRFAPATRHPARDRNRSGGRLLSNVGLIRTTAWRVSAIASRRPW